jgi:hypothetical protein
MSASDEPIGPTKTCEECEQEVANPAVMTPEGRDYALFFCGLDCYERWRQRNAERQLMEAVEKEPASGPRNA